MRLKKFSGLFVIFLFVSIVSLLHVSAAATKSVGPNPAGVWPSGTTWGTVLHFENTDNALNSSAYEAWFGVGTSEFKIASPPDKPDSIIVEFFDGSKWFEWVKAEADHENYPVRFRSVSTSLPQIAGGTLSSAMENAEAEFVPEDFSVVLEVPTQGLTKNLRRENAIITGLDAGNVLGTLYLDNAVNVKISPNSLTGNYGDNVSFTVTVSNTGRYSDIYSLVVDAGGSQYTISPMNRSINAGGSATATLTTVVGADNKVITVTADGTYADASASCAVNVTAEQLYALTTGVNPLNGGSVTLNPAGGIYASGTHVTATATPASGYEFDHWSGNASGTSNSVTIAMNSDKSITANFRVAGGGRTPWAWVGVGIVIVIAIIVVVVAATRGQKQNAK